MTLARVGSGTLGSVTRYRYGGQTYAEAALTPRAEAWRMLRALRHQPPGLAGADPGRRAVFVAALEQSEQFFTAAEASGPQTRGLQLFYGLVQSGRALRAAQQVDENWSRAGNHGISLDADSTAGAFADALVGDGKSRTQGAFTMASTTLDRASLRSKVRVGDLSGLLHPHARHPLMASGNQPAALWLSVARGADGRLPDAAARAGLRADLAVPTATWGMSLPKPPGRTTGDYDRYRDHVREQLKRYPTLGGAELYEPAPGVFEPQPYSADVLRLELIWPELSAWDGQDATVLHPFSDETERSVQVWPSMVDDPRGPDAPAAHPYLLWWAILYVVAHFVRYEPDRWAGLIDVDNSPEAVALEELGDRALDELPELIHRTLVRGEAQ